MSYEEDYQSVPEGPYLQPDSEQENGYQADATYNQQQTPADRRPAIGIRILLQCISFIVCLLLMVALTVGVVLADLRQIVSAGGIKQLVNTFLSAPASVQQEAEYAAPSVAPTQPAGYGVMHMSDYQIPMDEIPEDILTGGDGEENVNALIDWLYEELHKSGEVEVDFTKEQFESFVEKSTVTDYLSEKLAGFAEDFINGTENTNITTDELMGLLEENEAILQSELQIELTQEKKQELREELHKVVEEGDINTVIRDTVNETVEGALQESIGVDMQTVQQALKMLIANKLFFGILLVILVLVALLCLLNYYNVAAGLTWSGAAAVIVGFVMSVPIYALQNMSDLLSGLDAQVLMGVGAFVNFLAPIHYGLFITGLVVLVGSIVWQIVARYLRNR